MTQGVGSLEAVLQVFARPPVQGQVKTRLAASLGAEAALLLYKAFLEDALAAANATGHRVELAVAGDAEDAVFGATGQGLPKYAQVGDGLGARMAFAFERAARQGYSRSAIVGSDLPLMRPAAIEACLQLAESGAMVLAPTDDGGFWCVAGRCSLPWRALFSEVTWSGGGERQACIENARSLGVPVALGPVGQDIDTRVDFEWLLTRLRDETTVPTTLGRATRIAVRRLGHLDV